MIPNYRAWLKDDKEMIPVEDMTWNYGEFQGIGDGITYWKSAEDIILMQSTGLKDKNGVEIFEGDIVELSLIDIKKEFISKVCSSYGCFGVWVEYDFVSFHTLMEEYNIGYTLEVLGNLYENPELLEEQ